MNEIHILDTNTIDRIAAGEVVERPSSVVKELVENAIDAGAKHIAVEIKDGGTTLIRVTDDGSGIDKSQLAKVFMRHATSKIKTAEDLDTIMSLGFRGEALSSIAAVCQVEMMTKTKDALTGFRVCINGGEMEAPSEAGLPDGTTIVVKNIFYNTPVRRKFLKSPQTEGGYVGDLMQHIALSKPDVAIQFIANGQTKFYTSGNGDVKEIIYRIYGKDVAGQMIALDAGGDGIAVSGFLGKPILNRSNRSYETFFVNGRYIKSPLVSAAVEEGYKTFLMQHKYPFVVLHLTVDPDKIDVNVHPTKMDIRVNEPAKFLEFIKQAVRDGLRGKSLVQPMELRPFAKEEGAGQKERQLTKQIPQPFEQKRRQETEQGKIQPAVPPLVREAGGYRGDSNLSDSGHYGSNQNIGGLGGSSQNSGYQDGSSQSGGKQGSGMQDKSGQGGSHQDNVQRGSFDRDSLNANSEKDILVNRILGVSSSSGGNAADQPIGQAAYSRNIIKQKETVIVEKPQQMELFDEEDLKQQEIENFKMIGQVFDTYWILSLADKLYFVDQHAAHEKVMYERFMKHYREKQIPAQMLNPPVVVNVSPKERQVLLRHMGDFEALGFEVEEFGEGAYALRAVPMDLYGCGEKELFTSVLDELAAFPVKGDAEFVLMKIASMSCKAAVKGNMNISVQEAQVLMRELLACEDPYNCPHGRPTIISMTKYELEKKFKR